RPSSRIAAPARHPSSGSRARRTALQALTPTGWRRKYWRSSAEGGARAQSPGRTPSSVDHCVIFGLGEESLGIERRHAAHARRGDRLAVDFVGDVAGGENPGDRRQRGTRRDLEITVGIERQLALEEFG